MTTDAVFSHLFRLPSDRQTKKKPETLIGDESIEKESDNDENILCRQCCQVVTSCAERMEVQGAHQHTFANPGGVIYRIGCFRSVRGCVFIGSATEEWSWFKGFSWKIAVCSSCLTHLGWVYLSAGHKSFNGLILNRLIQTS